VKGLFVVDLRSIPMGISSLSEDDDERFEEEGLESDSMLITGSECVEILPDTTYELSAVSF